MTKAQQPLGQLTAVRKQTWI